MYTIKICAKESVCIYEVGGGDFGKKEKSINYQFTFCTSSGRSTHIEINRNSLYAYEG
jgi:hypothetical protein